MFGDLMNPIAFVLTKLTGKFVRSPSDLHFGGWSDGHFAHL